MRPFFSYYGSKYIGAKHYGPPRHDVVVEPFCGSAAYSTRWNVGRAVLFDLSENICQLWDWLIHCTANDVAAIPDYFDDMDQVMALDVGPQMLCRFWIAKGRAEPSTKLSPWYQTHRTATDCRVWGPAVKDRIISQKPHISRWTIEQSTWQDIPEVDAHWHVDPPYNNNPGTRYPHSSKAIDFDDLGQWCRTLGPHVDVCENEGATWLPFRPLYEVVASRGRPSGRTSKEVVWVKSENLNQLW